MALFAPRMAAEYPNHLLGASRPCTAYPRRAAILTSLVLLCLGLRFAMALRIPALNPDSVVYIQSAKALEAGDLRTAGQEIGLSLYPAILMCLHRAGMSWELGGMAWGVVIASLVVLPMFGWIRRQFDDRVALAACFLYAVHPKLIEWSPEVMRDATFWFLVMLSIYLLWRAVTEIRLRVFTAAGVSVVLACLTRFEGFFLLIPLVVWSFLRWLALRERRRRLVLGLVLCLGVAPVLALVAGVLGFKTFSGDMLPRLDPWTHFTAWLDVSIRSADDPSAALNPLVPPSERPLSAGRMLWVFIPTMTRGLSPLFALLMFGGLWGWRRVWSRPDHQALFYVAIAVLVGIWVHLWYDRGICPRYALSIVLLASPFAALGLLGLVDRATRWSAHWERGAAVRAVLVALPVVLVAGVGVADAMSVNQRYLATRKLAADLGRWLRESRRPTPILVGPVGITSIVGYYAEKGCYRFYRLDTTDAATIHQMAATYRPDVLLLRTTRRIDPATCESLVEQMKGRGFVEIEPVQRPPRSDPVAVLVNRRRIAALALSAYR